MKRLHITIFVLLFGVLLFLFIDILSFTFPYREQEHLFLYDRLFFDSIATGVGGLGEYIEMFIIQFSYIPSLGEAILALILSLIYLLSSKASRRICKALDPLSLAVLPVIYLLVKYEAFGFDLFHITNLFVVLVLIYLITLMRKGLVSLVILSLVMALSCYFFGWIYVCSAIAIVTLSAVSSFIFRNVGFMHRRWFVIVVLLIYGTIGSVMFVKSYNAKGKVMVLAEFALQRGEWDDVLEQTSKNMINGALINYYQNIALAYSDRLSTDLFNYRQMVGPKGLFVTFDSNTSQFTKVGHYVYQYLGHINEAVHWANESLMVYGETSYNLINLIKYNILLGKPEVAMRYIRRLEKSLFYSDVADSYREMIRVGRKPDIYINKGDGKDDKFIMTQNFYQELTSLTQTDPLNKNAAIYTLTHLLLDKRLDLFVTELIKYSNANLIDKSDISDLYLQALLLHSQFTGEVTALDHLLTDELKGRFKGYTAIKKAKNWNQLKREYGDSYWIYLDYSAAL